MNAERRKRINKVIEEIENLKSELEGIQEEEEDYRDNMPENLQGSERYERADANCENLYEAISNLEESASYLEEAQE